MALAIAVQFGAVSDAKAYLDPGTGSFIFQAIVALVVGASFALKMYWQRVKSYFRRKPSGTGNTDAEPDKGDNGRS